MRRCDIAMETMELQWLLRLLLFRNEMRVVYLGPCFDYAREMTCFRVLKALTTSCSEMTAFPGFEGFDYIRWETTYLRISKALTV